jgi:hypothetical protein
MKIPYKKLCPVCKKIVDDERKAQNRIKIAAVRLSKKADKAK